MLFYDKENIGYYGFAFIVTQAIFLAVTPIIRAISPKMMKAYGSHRNPQKLIKYLLILTQGMSLVVTILVGIIYIAANMVVTSLLPEYLLSISIIKILLIGSTFNTVAVGANTFTIAINKQKSVLLLQIIIILFQTTMIGLLLYIVKVSKQLLKE